MKNKNSRYKIIGFFYILPALAIIIFVYLNPIIRVAWYSLTDWKYFAQGGFNWFKNYVDLVNARYIYKVLLNNLIIIGGVIPTVIIIASFFANFIYLRIRGYKFYSFLFFVPVIIPTLVVAEVFITLLNKVGPLNTIWKNIGLDFLVVDWFGNPRFSLFAVILTIIWKNIGFAMILFLARLTTVEPSIYESAKVDGATDMQMARYITIPMLKNTIQVYVVLQMIGLTSFLFNYIYLMTDGGPGFSSTPLEYFVYTYTFKLQDMGRGSAAGISLIILTIILLFLYTYVMKRQKKGET